MKLLHLLATLLAVGSCAVLICVSPSSGALDQTTLFARTGAVSAGVACHRVAAIQAILVCGHLSFLAGILLFCHIARRTKRYDRNTWIMLLFLSVMIGVFMTSGWLAVLLLFSLPTCKRMMRNGAVLPAPPPEPQVAGRGPMLWNLLPETAVSLIWLAGVFALKLQLFHNFRLIGDIAQYANALYNTGQGMFLYSDIGFVRWGQTTFLNEHFSPTFALLAPLYHLCPSPVLLLAVGAMAIATAGLLVAWIARTVLNGLSLPTPYPAVLSVICQLTFLMHPFVMAGVLDTTHGFHHDALIPPFMLGVCLQTLRRRWVSAGLCCLLLLGLKENLPILAIVFLCSMLVMGIRMPTRPAITMLLCALVMLTGSAVFQYRPGARHVSVIKDYMFVFDLFAYLPGLLPWRQILFMWPALFCPVLLPACLAELSLHVLVSSQPESWRSFTAMSLCGMGFALGIGKLAGFARRKYGRRGLPALLTIVLVASCLPAVTAGTRIFLEARKELRSERPHIERKSLEQALAMVPAETVLAVTSDLIVYSVNRHHLRWSDQARGAQYLLISKYGTHPDDERLRGYVLRRADNTTLLHDDGCLRLYEVKTPDIATAPRQGRPRTGLRNEGMAQRHPAQR